MKTAQFIFSGICLIGVLAGCGGEKVEDAATKAQSPEEIAAALDQGPRAAEGFTLDIVLADQGASLFDAKSCSDCHTMGEADLAPDLAGVLERRTLPWLVKQIADPEWMNAHDPLTKALISEFDMEMVTPEVTDDEAEAIIHYLAREHGGSK